MFSRKIIFIISFFIFQNYSDAIVIGGEVKLPVMGTILEQKNNAEDLFFKIESNSVKVHSPLEGTVFYVGKLKDYGLSVIIKNNFRVTIVGNLDRSYLVKNQFVYQGDIIGSVAYHAKIIFTVQQVHIKKFDYKEYLAHQKEERSHHYIEKFQNKLFDFINHGIHKTAQIGSNSLKSLENKLLNFSQLESMLQNIGFPQKSIPTMYCIAKWESGLNPKALNFNTNNTVDVGLFQINSRWFKKCNTNLSTLYDENENSRCALTVFQNQGFPAWTSYNKFKNSADYCN